MSLVIYTCIIGGYDPLIEPFEKPEDIDFVCFVGPGEKTCERVGAWQIRELPPLYGDKTLLARYPKMHPHELLQEYECSLWIDGNIAILDGTLYEILRAKAASGVLYSGVPHPDRDCLYDEARKCVDMGYLSWSELLSLRSTLRRSGFPRHYGLLENNLIFRRHMDPAIVRLDSLWWEKVLGCCRRDQLSLMPLLRSEGISYDSLLLGGLNCRTFPGLEYRLHGYSFSPALERAERPLVSIVIVCMNRPDNLYPCLESIRRQTSVPYETFVVAYLFDRLALQKAKTDFPWVNFVESTATRGFSENNNLALRLCRGKYILVLNDDTVMSEPVVDGLVDDFERRLPAEAAIVAPRLLNADGSLQLCGRPEYPAYKYVLQQWHLYKEPIDNGTGLFQTFNISGACFLIKREVFSALGWFDERYFFTPEDIALSTLARQKGYSVWTDAELSLTHKHRTTASRLAPAVRPCAIRGSLMFFSKGSKLRYILLGLGVWSAEATKYLKARLKHHGEEALVYKNNCRSIFTCKSPKQIFSKLRNLQ